MTEITTDDVRKAYLAGCAGTGETFDTWFNNYLRKRDLPKEPPVGTVLLSKTGVIWVRNTNLRWYRHGTDASCTWAEAYEQGADPNRRLIVAPDSEDKALVDDIVQHTVINGWGTPITQEDLHDVVSDIIDRIANGG